MTINGPISRPLQRLTVLAFLLCTCKSTQGVAPKEKHLATATTGIAASDKSLPQAAVFDAKECPPASSPSVIISKLDLDQDHDTTDCVESEQQLSAATLCRFAKSLQTLAPFSSANTLIVAREVEDEVEQAKEIRRGWQPVANGEIEIENNGMFVHKQIGARTVFYCFVPDYRQANSYTVQYAGKTFIDHLDENRRPTALP